MARVKEYEIKKGRLCLDNKPIKLKFGDQDQIKIIRAYEKRVEQLQTSGFVLEPIFTARVSFKCICDKLLDHEVEFETFNRHQRAFVNDEKDCAQCNRNYRFYINEENEIIVKLIK